MSTQSVPGADPKNLDKLDVGCWAEDKKGTSLLHVIGHEGGSVVFQIYDLNERPPLFYQDAMLEDEFKSYFSTPPVGKSKTKWKWHDKKSFPWDQVMKRLSGKVPVHADVQDHMSVAKKIAKKLGLRGRKLAEADVTPKTQDARDRGMAIISRLAEALGRIAE